MDENLRIRLRSSLLPLKAAIPETVKAFTMPCHYNVGVSLAQIRATLLEALDPQERQVFAATVPPIDFVVPKKDSDPTGTVSPGEARRLYDQLEQYLSVKEGSPLALSPKPARREASQKVFIVHGHDEDAREKVARFVEKLELEPVILHEQANSGMTVIEKLERHADVSFAIVLLTPDDEGGILGSGTLHPRARQNVILELGYFLGRLGRHAVCALYKGEVEIPSDYRGVLFVQLDKADGWKIFLAKELKKAGFDVDLNRAL